MTNAVYLLALNWTPEWCRSGGSGATAKEMECDRPFGFTLHGLWPNGLGKPYPRYCRPVGGLDAATVRQMYCRTPSPTLLQHEWQAHGTCAAWPTAQAYFGQAARLFDQLKMPKIETIAPGGLTAGAVRAAFVARNPWLKPTGSSCRPSATGTTRSERGADLLRPEVQAGRLPRRERRAGRGPYPPGAQPHGCLLSLRTFRTPGHPGATMARHPSPMRTSPMTTRRRLLALAAAAARRAALRPPPPPRRRPPSPPPTRPWSTRRWPICRA